MWEVRYTEAVKFRTHIQFISRAATRTSLYVALLEIIMGGETPPIS
jgi:hypothetical protein